MWLVVKFCGLPLYVTLTTLLSKTLEDYNNIDAYQSQPNIKTEIKKKNKKKIKKYIYIYIYIYTHVYIISQ